MKYNFDEVLSLPKFKHEDLEPGAIRMFELHAGNDMSPIQGVLRSVALDQAHKSYEALSYVWGDASLNHTIVCNGCRMDVTANLYSALSRLRRPNESLVLWLDGICIDQGSDPAALRERSLQVNMMSDVYSCAYRVIIDLGDTDQNFDYLIEKLEQYARWDEDPTTIVLRGTVKLPGSDVTDLQDTQLQQELIQVMQLPWFSRLWCFQEYVLAPSIATLFGKRLIADFDLHLGISRAALRLPNAFVENEELSSKTDQLLTSAQNFQRTLLLTTRKQVLYYHFRQKSIDIMIEGLMMACRLMAATDVRDRVYALRALWPKDIISDFATDYMETAHALQQRFSTRLVEGQYAIWTLMFACGPDLGVPSWTIALMSDEQRYWKQEQMALCANSVFEFDPDWSEAVWSAGGTWPSSIKLGQEAGELLVEGYCLDHVVSQSDRLPPADMDEVERSYTVMFDWMSGLLQWIQETKVSEDDMWRALMFDGYGETRNTPQYAEAEQRNAAFGASFRSLRRYVTSKIGSEHDHHLAKPFVSQIWACMPNMRLAVTSNGTLAVVPYTTSIADRIAIFTGVNAPFVLREQGSKYQLVGACYLHGLMDGQVIKREDWSPEPLTII